MKTIFTAAIFLLLSPVAHAQQVDETFASLLSARSIRCELGKGTQASWDSGKLKLESSHFGAGGKVTFDSIDIKGGKARIIANVGASDAIVLVTASGITFM